MAFDWEDYSKLALDLVDINTEAAFRSAISRCYYARYHRCLHYAAARRYKKPGTSGIHQGLISWFLGTQRTRMEQEAGRLLSKLKDLRVLADYKDGAADTVDDDVVQDALLYAEQLDGLGLV